MVVAKALRNRAPEAVLAKAAVRAASALGLSREELGKLIGRDRTSISRGIDPDSKPGELALYLIRCYRALSVLVGDDENEMRHWFATENAHTGGIPKQQVQSVQGLVRVMEYLDAIRGRV